MERPRGPFDFSDGRAELLIGGLRYNTSISAVLRVKGKTIISLKPGRNGEPGAITADIYDRAGALALQLRENSWIGPVDRWDLVVEGQRLTIREGPQDPLLILRVDPPGSVVVERLDMRVGKHHILATERKYLVGRSVEGEDFDWTFVNVEIDRASPDGCAIELDKPDRIRKRYRDHPRGGAELVAMNNELVINWGFGVSHIPSGLVVASKADRFKFLGMAKGECTIAEARQILFFDPDNLERRICQRGASRVWYDPSDRSSVF